MNDSLSTTKCISKCDTCNKSTAMTSQFFSLVHIFTFLPFTPKHRSYNLCFLISFLDKFYDSLLVFVHRAFKNAIAVLCYVPSFSSSAYANCHTDGDN